MAKGAYWFARVHFAHEIDVAVVFLADHAGAGDRMMRTPLRLEHGQALGRVLKKC